MVKVCSLTPKAYWDKHKENEKEEEESEEEDLFFKSFRCGKCSKSFETRREVQWHARRSHLKMRSRKVVIGSGNEDEMDCDNFSASTVAFPGTSGIIRKARRARVVLKRLRLCQIDVTTPSKGVREIRYTLEAGSSSSSSISPEAAGTASPDSDSGISSGGSGSPSPTKFNDWRQATIPALPKKIVSPPPPSVPSKSSPQILPPSPPPSNSDKSLHLELPSELCSMFNINGITDDVHSILDIITGHKMRTTSLDAYLTKRLHAYNTEINVGIRNAYKLRPISSTKFHYISVLFIPVFEKETPIEDIHPDLQYLPKGPFDDNCVLIVPLYTCGHFYLSVLNCYTKNVYVYDSAWSHVSNQTRLNQVAKLLLTVFPEDTRRWNIHFKFKCAQQIDDLSCGCYVIYFTENHLKSKSHRNMRNMNKEELIKFRLDIVTDLLPTTKTGSRFLEAITE